MAVAGNCGGLFAYYSAAPRRSGTRTRMMTSDLKNDVRKHQVRNADAGANRVSVSKKIIDGLNGASIAHPVHARKSVVAHPNRGYRLMKNDINDILPCVLARLGRLALINTCFVLGEHDRSGGATPLNGIAFDLSGLAVVVRYYDDRSTVYRIVETVDLPKVKMSRETRELYTDVHYTIDDATAEAIFSEESPLVSAYWGEPIEVDRAGYYECVGSDVSEFERWNFDYIKQWGEAVSDRCLKDIAHSRAYRLSKLELAA